LIRHWNEKGALEWNKTAMAISGPAFLAVVGLGVLTSWRTIIDLIGDRVMLAAIVFVVVMVVIGYFLSVGGRETRAATSMVQIGSNSGPSFAAVAIAFGNDPAILGAVVAILFFQIIGGGLIGSWMGKDHGEPAEEGQEASDSAADMAGGTANG
jgi:BASS family bile acid:Na+ symporter